MTILNFDHRCKYCNSFIIYNFTMKEENGKYASLDLNYKSNYIIVLTTGDNVMLGGIITMF